MSCDFPICLYRPQTGSSFTWHPCYHGDFVEPRPHRPISKQLEHDRVIRLLQTKFRRRFNISMNPGAQAKQPRLERVSPPSTRMWCSYIAGPRQRK